MTTSFSKLLTDCLLAMGDEDASTWSRTDVIIPWAKEAILAFPILRPVQLKLSCPAYASRHGSYALELPDDFRELVCVEYPVAQEPPCFLHRMNRLDPDFYEHDDHYDIDRNYVDGKGFILWTSKIVPVGEYVAINYLGNHKTDLTDSTESLLSVPDEYEHILIAYVAVKGYRERLGAYMQDPTAHTSIINQMYEMVQHAEERYQKLVDEAVARYTDARVSPHFKFDKFDRAY